ncbi:response regulator transcription factor [Sphingomonas sp. UNC305MFCol5.2]|uniref:response regulator transcription factor n=1 Tax=Sphingomonas sp. UNC305MFCol5.2 TaxID=1449076 RepID=UPI00068ACDCB|nr:response regulator [Sphingomonas sp. UNC305MFCol5.2]
MRDDRSLIIVEDDAPYANVLARSLERRGYRVRIAADPGAVAKLLDEDAFRYAIVDLNLNPASGLPCIEALRRANAATRILMVSGFANPANAAEAIRLGACGCLAKPVSSDDIEAAFLGAWPVANSRSTYADDVCDLSASPAADTAGSDRR